MKAPGHDKRYGTGSAAILTLLLCFALNFCSSCSRHEIIDQIDDTIALAYRVPVTTDDEPWKMVEGVYGFGSLFSIKDAVTQEHHRAVMYLDGIKMPGLIKEDRYGPYFTAETRTGRAVMHRNHFTGAMVYAGVDAYTSFTSDDGGYNTLNDFLRRSAMMLDIEELSESSEVITGPDGNELGWTLLMIAGSNLVTAEWMNHKGRAVKTDQIVELALSRPIEWGSYNGLMEQFGIAAALRSYRMYRLREELAAYEAETKKEEPGAMPRPDLYSVELEGIWIETESHVEEVVELMKQNQRKLGGFDAGWAGGGEGEREADASEIALYTGHALDFLAVALPDDSLEDPWVLSAVDRLATVVRDNRFQLYDDVWALAHAAHALKAYKQRLENKGKPIEFEKPFDDSIPESHSCCD